MKIAFVYDAIYPWVKGGAEKRIYELGKRLAGNGHEVHVFGIKWWDGASVIRYENIVLHGVCRQMELYTNGRRSVSEAVIFSIDLLPHLVKEKFDVIDVSAFPYFSCFSVKLLSFLRRTPMIVTWHEVWKDYWYEYLGWRGFFGKLIESMVSKIAPGSIAVSATTKNNLELLGSKNIHIVPNGVDLKKIARIQPSVYKCDIIFVGRLIKEKNVDILIKAVDYIRRMTFDVKCHIIGSGPEKERLTEIAAMTGLMDNIRFFERMEHDEVIARIKSSKVLVLPSMREGFGMVVIEAFACGVPVITVRSPLNAASELVGKEMGFVVNPDAQEVGDAIRLLITNHELHEHMSKCAFDSAQRYDWNNIVKQLTHIYGTYNNRTFCINNNSEF